MDKDQRLHELDVLIGVMYGAIKSARRASTPEQKAESRRRVRYALDIVRPRAEALAREGDGAHEPAD